MARARARFLLLVLALVLPGPGGLLAQGSAERTGASEAATAAGLVFAREDGSCCEAAPSLGTAAHLVVTGALVRGEVTQIFVNPTERWLEAVYVFPLLDGAAVHGFRMRVGGRTVEGRVAEREAARRAFAAAAAEGKKASLLELGSPDLFRLSVTNLGPGETVEVTLRYQHEASYRDGRFGLRFPTVAAPRYGQRPESAPPLPSAGAATGGVTGPQVGLRVDLDAGFPLASVESPTHGLAIAELPAGRRRITLVDDVVPADGDFVLEWTPAAGDRLLASVTVEEAAGERYALVHLVPPPQARQEPGIPRDVVFVLDTSGSMAGGALAQASHAVLAALGRLQPTDRFNVVRFSDRAEALFDASRAADPFALAAASQFVAGLRAEGGTEALPALELALPAATTGAWGSLRQVVFLTDGRVADVETLLRTVGERAGETRLFTVGIGPAPSSHFMRRLAEIGRGTATFIDDPARIAEDMEVLLRKLEGPVLRDVVVDWGGAAAETHPDPVPDLLAGEPLVLAARLTGRAESVVVSASGSDGPWRVELPLEGAGAARRAPGVSRLWAQRRVEALEARRIGGAAPDALREEILDLALRHGLVTELTSLVAVDVTPTAPRATMPDRAEVPVGPLRSTPAPGMAATVAASQGTPIEEVVTVTSEHPLLDARRICRATTVSALEYQKLPWAGSPWALVLRTPGALPGRVDVAGLEGHAQPRRLAAGAPGAVRIDGLETTAAGAAASLSLVDLSFVPLEQLEVTLGGADAELASAAPTVEVLTPRGTNGARGSVWAAWSGHDLRSRGEVEGSEAGGLDRLGVAGGEGGGPLVRDRLWAWGSGGGSRIGRTALGGDRGSSALDQGAAKVNGQPTTASSVVLAVRRSELEASGLGAGPDRAPETTLEESASGRSFRLEVTQVFSSSFFLTAAGGAADRDLDARPADGGDAELAVDSAGIARGSFFRSVAEERLRSWRVAGKRFAGSGPWEHEIGFGAERTEGEAESRSGAPGRGLAVVAGELLGFAGGPEVLAAWRDGGVGSRTVRHALWLEDTLSRGALTARIGLRWDGQEVESAGGAVAGNPHDPLLAPVEAAGFEVASAGTLSPRLGLSWALGAARSHLLRLSLARFAGRLDHAVAAHAHPLRPAVRYSLFRDLDGDLVADPGELAAAAPWTAEGVDPVLGGPAGAVAADLEPEVTDEAVLGYEWEVAPGAAVGLTVAWQRTDGVLEERFLVRDAVTGEVAPAEAGDWVPAGVVGGVLPDGTPYETPYFDLRPGLFWTGGRLLTDGSRRREVLSVTFDWTRRLSDGWMTRGHATWSAARWRVPAEFGRFDDPTPEAGGGEVDGEPVVLGGGGAAPAADAGWSLFAGAYYRLPGGFELGGAVTGREGQPIVYHRRVLRQGAGPVAVAVTPDPTVRRTGDLVTLDARLARELEVAGGVLEVALEAFNLLDERTVSAREADLGATRGGLANEVLAPRTFRLALRLRWR